MPSFRRDGPEPATAVLDVAWVATALLAALPVILAIGLPGALSPAERVAALGVVVLAAWTPLDALLLLVAFAPLGATIAALAGTQISVTDWLLPATLTGGALAVSRRQVSLAGVPRWLTGAALVLGWLALASVAVQLLRDRAWFETAAGWRAAVGSYVTAGAFTGLSRWRTVTSGILLAQQALVVPLAASLALRPGAAHRLAAMCAAGAIGTAAQNALRVIEGAMRASDPWTALWAIAMRSRISAAFADKNAAGSFFALGVLLVAALLWHAVRARRWTAAAGWSGALALTGLALYLTGSRVALALTLPVAVVTLAATRERLHISHRGLATAALVVAVTIALVATAQARRGRNDAPMAAFVRVEFAGTTWRMIEAHPLFGVGAGNYRRASGTYSSPALRRIYPTQNAHNNFLQIAGELGPLALAAFLVLVGLPAWRGWRDCRERGDPIVMGLWAGTLAFLLTCVAGHPLLVPEVAAAVSVVIGTLAGAAAGGSPAVPSTRGRWQAAALLALLAALVVSVPVRVRAERASLDLEGTLVGDDKWTERSGEGDVVQFADSVAFFLRGDGGRLVLELRPSRPTRTPVDVTLKLDGRPINVVRLQDAGWQGFPVVLPRVPGRGFVVLRLDAAWSQPGTKGRPVVEVRRPRR